MLKSEAEQGWSQSDVFFISFFDIVNDRLSDFPIVSTVGLNWGKRTSEGVVQHTLFTFDCNGLRRFRERYSGGTFVDFDRNLDIHFILLLQALEKLEAESQQYK